MNNSEFRLEAAGGSSNNTWERWTILGPFVAVIGLGLLLVAASIALAFYSLNHTAEETARRLGAATLAREIKRVAELTIDYAFWDEAAQKLTRRPDEAWADQNIGGYMTDTFGISLSAVLDVQGRRIMNFRDGRLLNGEALAIFGPRLNTFVLAGNQAEAGIKPELQAQLMRAGDGIYIVGFAPFTPETSRAGDTGRRPRPILVLARKLDEALLEELGAAVDLEGFRVLETKPDNRPHIVLPGPLGSIAGYAVWRQDYPGDVLLWRMAPGAAGMAVVMAVLIIMMFRRTDEIIRARHVLANELSRERNLNEIRSRFISMISHEVRTPVATIQAASDLLRHYWQRLTDSERNSELATIQNAVQNIRATIEDVISLDKAGSPAGSLEAVDLAEMCRQQWSELVSASRTSHKLDLQVSDKMALVYADVKLLRPAIRNLLGNAIKYSPGGSLVRVHLNSGDENITLRVEDQGCGVPPADAERIFEPFYRGANVNHIQGIGIGLAIVKSAVHQMRGTVFLAPGDGSGACFELTLPKAGIAAT